MEIVDVGQRYCRTQIGVSYADLCRLQPDEQLAYFLDRLKEAQVVSENTDTAQILRYFQVNESHKSCVWKYQSNPYHGRITLFRSESAAYDLSLWASFSSQPLVVQAIPGQHDFIVSDPYVRSLAAQLQHCLDEAGNTNHF